MANYSALKAAIQAVIKTNGAHEITGANMQATLLSIIDSLGNGYQLMGVATPSTTPPSSPDYNIAYIAGAGSYTNFGTAVVIPPTNIAIFKYDGSWACEQVTVENGGVFDITAYNNNTTYADLAAALGTGGANVPESVRKGGMSIKFVQSSDNKYAQFRYMSSSTAVADFTNVSNWQNINNIQDKLLVIKTFATTLVGSGIDGVGQIYYNTDNKRLRRCTKWNSSISDSTFEIVPFYDGAIYTYNNRLYVWNGTDLVLAGSDMFINVNLLNNKQDAYTDARTARNDINPVSLRRCGLTITYLLNDGWHTEQFTGTTISPWGAASTWLPISPIPMEVEINERASASDWQPSTEYSIGDIVNVDNANLECVEAHTSAASFDYTESTKWTSTPDNTGNDKILLYGTTIEDVPNINKLIELKSIFGNAFADVEVGDIYYNEVKKQLRKKLSNDNLVYIPFYQGAIYTYNNRLYVWNGSDLVLAGGDMFININILNNKSDAYADARTARNSLVPACLRKCGLTISYLLADGWHIEQFTGTSVSPWGGAATWLSISPLIDIQKNERNTASDWQPNTSYSVGDIVNNNNANWECVTAHTSSSVFDFMESLNWVSTPDNTGNDKMLVSGVDTEEIPSVNKLIELKSIVGNALSRVEIGDVFYHDTYKQLRKKISNSEVEIIPFYKGSIYTYNGHLYVWNGTALVPTCDNASVEIQEYFENEMETTINSVLALKTEPCIVFPLITDIHYRFPDTNPKSFDHSIENIKYFMARVKCDFLVNLGDSSDGRAPKLTQIEWSNYQSKLFASLKTPCFFVSGNHELNIYKRADFYDGSQQLTNEEIYTLYYNCMPIDVVYNPNHNHDWYKDFDEMGIRLVGLDFSNGNPYEIGNSTVSWFRDYALDTDKTVLLLTHYCSIPEHNSYPEVYTHANYAVMTSVIQNFITGGGTLINLTGHSHSDFHFTSPWLQISFNNQRCLQSDINTEPYDTLRATTTVESPARTYGTVTEDCWSVVVVRPQSRKIDYIRFGAGNNKSLTY